MFQYDTSGELSAGATRAVGGSALSIVLHICVGLSAVFVSHVIPSAPPKPVQSALTFMAAVPVAVIPEKPATVDVAALDLPKPEPPKIELAPVPVSMPSPLPAIARAEVMEPIPVAAPPVARPVVAEPPPSRQVMVGAFAEADVPIRSSETSKQIAVAGFDAAPSSAQDVRQARVVADAGFGAFSSEAVGQPRARVVADTGFGDAQLGARTSAPQAKRVAESGFSDSTTPPPAPVKPAPVQERAEIPLEVLSKPNPTYTAEARELRIEGEVSLDVEFHASGSVRVLRVVRGLGHGLDEEAIKAAERIRFKPARTRGQAVDVRTTVHISFRLS